MRYLPPGDLSDLFPAAARVATTLLRMETVMPPVFPSERKAMVPMRPGRQREYAWGRHAARQALRTLGVPPTPLPTDGSRMPVWPHGVSGSISHSHPLCAAVVVRGPHSVGIDIETVRSIDPDLWPDLFTSSERRRIETIPTDALILFTAKEAAFKAHFPLHRRMFDFRDLNVSLYSDGTFRAEFTRLTGNGFAPITGRWIHDFDFAASGVILDAPPSGLH